MTGAEGVPVGGIHGRCALAAMVLYKQTVTVACDKRHARRRFWANDPSPGNTADPAAAPASMFGNLAAGCDTDHPEIVMIRYT